MPVIHTHVSVPTISRGRVTFVDAALPQGVVVPDANLAVFSIADLNARMDANRARSRRKVDITQITFPFKPGDYVVHATHGIALFSEIARQEVGGKERDYFLLEYADGETHGGKKLRLPHPLIGERDFVLVPLEDLMHDPARFFRYNGVEVKEPEDRVGHIVGELGRM